MDDGNTLKVVHVFDEWTTVPVKKHLHKALEALCASNCSDGVYCKSLVCSRFAYESQHYTDFVSRLMKYSRSEMNITSSLLLF